MTTLSFVIIIAGCAIVTWLPRIIPFAIVKNMNISPLFMRWLSYIPVCVLSALVVQSLLNTDGNIVSINWTSFLAFIPTMIVALWTKSLSKTVVVGVIVMAIIRYIS